MKNHLFVPIIAAGFLLAASMGAVAQATAESSEWSMLQAVLDAFKSSNPTLAAMLALVLLAALASRYGATKVPFLGTGTGKALVVLVGSFGGAAATAMTGGAAMGVGLIIAAVMVAIKAAGGYSLIKSLIIEPLGPYIDKAPGWVKVPFALISWVFAGSGTTKKAEAAGQAAVDAAPPIATTFQDVP